MKRKGKPGPRDRKPEKSKEASRESRGAFVFTDRSGKTHTIAGGARPRREPEEREEDDRKKFEKKPGIIKPHAKPVEENRRARTSHGARPPYGRDDREESRGFSKKFKKEGKSFGKHAGRGKGGGREDREDRGGGRRGERHRGESSHASGKRDRSRGRSERKRNVPSSDVIKLKATIDKNRKGFAFLQFENRDYEDAFLNPYEAERFFHGDRVEATISDRGEVVELRVIAHRFRELVGRFFPLGREGVVVYERKRAREEIPVIGGNKGAKSRDWVRAKMIYPETGPLEERTRIECEVEEVYGEELPARADIQMVSAEYNLTEEHSSDAVAEAESFKLDLQDPNRVDLRHVPFITIDGETARDFDDAVYVERTKGGGFILWVAIADVSHYVRDGTQLDEEAYARGTSVYFPERAFHMLPRALSENLCSLRPNEPRLTMTSKIEFDRHGHKIGVEVMNTLIESRRRATYNEIQAEAEKNESDPNWEYASHFALYRILRKLRNDRGSIDFDLPEAEVRVEPTGEPISIKNRPRLDAHRLIEEFMIAANESVTEWALERNWPFISRVHDEPPRGALVRFQELCAHYGVNFVLPGEGSKASERKLAEALNAVVKEVAEHPAQVLINTALLRSMAQAHYSAVYGEHFGLASKAYTHFTSPIRRYPDLVVHRMLKLALDHEREKRPLSEKDREVLDEELYEVAEHCSYRERIASDAEREAIKLKQVRIMLKEVGNEFEGKIVGLTESGMFVGINDPFVEGFVSQDTMTEDFFSFNEQRQVFVGRRTKKTYKIGDPVKVRVDRVDIDLRRVDFALIG